MVMGTLYGCNCNFIGGYCQSHHSECLKKRFVPIFQGYMYLFLTYLLWATTLLQSQRNVLEFCPFCILKVTASQ
jgi:hypothetical protein